MTPPFTDSLVDSAMVGDARALEMLWTKYQPVARRSAAKYLTDPGEIDQAASQGLSKAILNLKKWSGTGQFAAWVAQVVRNETIDWIRQHKDRVSKFHDITDFDLRADDARPDRITMNLILEFVNSLPERQKQAFTLVVYEDLPYKTAAACMKTSIGAVKSNVHDAREKLKKQLAKVGLK